MKRIIYTLILFVTMLFPVICPKAEVCSKDLIIEMNAEIDSVEIELEYMKEDAEDNGVDISNRYKAFSNNLPAGYSIELSEAPHMLHKISGKYYTYLDGGVYTVKFYNDRCGDDVIKQYQIMIPYYDSNNEDNTWFDGTYAKDEQKEEENKKINNIYSFILKIALIIFTIVVLTVLLFLKKRRNVK